MKAASNVNSSPVGFSRGMGTAPRSESLGHPFHALFSLFASVQFRSSGLFFIVLALFAGFTLVAARKQLEIVNNQYRDGLITYLEVATAESTALNVEFTATQLRGQQLVATVTLIKALGGSWQSNET